MTPGLVLSELPGRLGFQDKVDGLARSNLVQQGGELAYLIRHDPEFRGVRREHLVEAGRRVRLRRTFRRWSSFSNAGGRLPVFVLRDFGGAARTRSSRRWRESCRQITSTAPSSSTTRVRRSPVDRSRAGRLRKGRRHRAIGSARSALTPDRTIYVGDGSSDVHVMLHVNNRDGFTIAVSENQQLARIAKTTVLSDNAFSIMVPVFEQILGLAVRRHARAVRANGLTLHEWEKARTDRITVRESSPARSAAWPEIEERAQVIDYLGWAATVVFVGVVLLQAARNASAVQMVGGVMWVVYGS